MYGARIRAPIVTTISGSALTEANCLITYDTSYGFHDVTWRAEIMVNTDGDGNYEAIGAIENVVSVIAIADFNGDAKNDLLVLTSPEAGAATCLQTYGSNANPFTGRTESYAACCLGNASAVHVAVHFGEGNGTMGAPVLISGARAPVGCTGQMRKSGTGLTSPCHNRCLHGSAALHG